LYSTVVKRTISNNPGKKSRVAMKIDGKKQPKGDVAVLLGAADGQTERKRRERHKTWGKKVSVKMLKKKRGERRLQ